MLKEMYIEALLIDEQLADQVWEAWDKAEIDDQVAWFAWLPVSLNSSEKFRGQQTVITQGRG